MSRSSSYACSIVIPLFNRVDLTAKCVESLIANTPDVNFELIMVDNGSTDGTQDLCAMLDGDVTIIRNDVNQGFAIASNQGAAAAKSERILFLNNDTEAHPGWLPPLIRELDSADDIAAVGALLLYPDGLVQHSGVAVFERSAYPQLCPAHVPYRASQNDPLVRLRRDVTVATGACLMVRADRFFEVGGFDEEYWNGCEDVDLCLKFGAQGWRVRYEPASVLTHHESASGPERFRSSDENVRRLHDIWLGNFTPDMVLNLDGDAYQLHPDGILANYSSLVGEIAHV